MSGLIVYDDGAEPSRWIRPCARLQASFSAVLLRRREIGTPACPLACCGTSCFACILHGDVATNGLALRSHTLLAESFDLSKYSNCMAPGLLQCGDALHGDSTVIRYQSFGHWIQLSSFLDELNSGRACCSRFDFRGRVR